MTIIWLIGFIAALIGLQGLVYRRLALSGVSYERYFDQSTVFAGEQIAVVERLVNRSLLPVPWLRVEAMFSVHLQFASQGVEVMVGQAFQYHRSIISLGPLSQLTRCHTITCLRRGYHHMDAVAITSGDAFGVATKTMTLRPHSNLLVYPRILDIQDLSQLFHSLQGDFVVRRWIVSDPFLTAGVREYQPGDPYTQVNWKATARTGQLQVHQRDFTADDRLLLLVNFECDETMWSAVTDIELVEAGLSLAASIAVLVSMRGLAVGFGCNGWIADHQDRVRLAPQTGDAHLEALLATLAKLAVTKCWSFLTLLSDELETSVTGVDFLLVTAFVTPTMQEIIIRLQAAGNSVAVISPRWGSESAHDTEVNYG